MAYSDFKKYASGFQADVRLELGRMQALCEALGNPETHLKFIHVAGTNGKGSVCAFLQSMLTHAGYKTGKYTSPNMVCVNERLCIDGENISDERIESIFGRVEKACVKAEKKTGEYPTQFEIWTASAFLYFYEEKCDYVVLEVGLGGRFDATNVIKNPALCVITRIDLDHMQFLGNTIKEIAFEKAGIIKPGAPVVTVKQSEEALSVFENITRERGCELYIENALSSSGFESIYEICGGVKLALGGINQTENAAAAIKAAKLLSVPEKSIVYGLTHAKHPGRFDMVRRNVIYDGAHNPNGVKALAASLKRYFPHRKMNFIMAAMADKDINSSLLELSRLISMLFTVTVKDNPRSLSGEDFEKKARLLGINATAMPSVSEALKECEKEDSLTVICGSLYLYKDLYDEVLSKENNA